MKHPNLTQAETRSESFSEGENYARPYAAYLDRDPSSSCHLSNRADRARVVMLCT